MEFGKECWRSYEQGITREWLLTNGIGGFASATVTGANTRRYHGLLVASLRPPVERQLILSKINETLKIGGREYELFSHEAGGSIMNGAKYLQHFELNPLPVFTYGAEDVFVEKTVCMVYGENTAVILYRLKNGGSRTKLSLTPLVNYRDYHHTSSRWHMNFSQKPGDASIIINPYGLDKDINISCSGSRYIPYDNCWFMGMNYAVERERGLDWTEDHYIPGSFEIEVEPWEDRYVTFTATVEKNTGPKDGRDVIKAEIDRRDRLVKNAGCKDEFAARLTAAADQFIVYRRSTDAKTVIAGYPWFTDWGRDTMIAVNGLTLATRRFDDAQQILYTFSKYVRYGLVPNVFPDAGQEPYYNSVDAALWYFEAVAGFLRYTERYDFIKEQIYPSLKQIADSFMEGTLYGIRMDDDSLITSGDEGTQLTWMDAKVGTWVVTPRHGKAVEINALWYNALEVMAQLAERFGNNSGEYKETAYKVRKSFIQCFWNEQSKCLYDVVREDFRDGKIRPNQILAVSLSNPVIDGKKARLVVETVWKKLYTAYGLRSLAQDDPEYRGIYTGDQYSRDGAYHQGTVWAWLTGPFVTAFARVFKDEPWCRDTMEKLFLPFRDHLFDACLGSISEIFDGDEPHHPRGCFAQAWSVGEILRAYSEEMLK